MWRNLLRWARITKAGVDGKQFAEQQVSYMGKVADSVMVFPYGMHGNVPVDYLTVMAAMAGNAENRAVLGCLPKTRPELAEGETAFYHPPTNAFIIWRSTGALEIQTGEGGGAPITVVASQVDVTAPVINMTGDVTIDGNLSVTGSGSAATLPAIVTSGGQDISGTHTHGGVQTGGGTTGTPNS